MPIIKLENGVNLYYEERGEGTPILLFTASG